MRRTERAHRRRPDGWETEIGPDGLRGPVRHRHRAGRRRARLRRRAPHGRAARGRRASPASSSRRPCSAGVTDDMRIMKEEIFGPVVPIITVDDRGGGARAGQRLELRPRRLGLDPRPRQGRADGARGSSPGWSGSTTTPSRTRRCQCSWGGVKDSGLGRSHSKFGLYECAEVKLVAWEPGPHPRPLVAALRRDAGQGAALLRPAPLRPQRPARQGAARRRPGARQGRRPHPAQGRLSPPRQRVVDHVTGASATSRSCDAAGCRCPSTRTRKQ